MSDTTIVLYFVILLVTYILPMIVAINRNHRNKLAISMLNILLGWSLIGWIIAMVWACTSDVAPREKVWRGLMPDKPADPMARLTSPSRSGIAAQSGITTDTTVRIVCGLVVVIVVLVLIGTSVPYLAP